MATSEEIYMLDLVNIERKKYVLPSLIINDWLCDIARDHSKEQMKAGKIFHNSPITGSVSDRLSKSSVLFAAKF